MARKEWSGQLSGRPEDRDDHDLPVHNNLHRTAGLTTLNKRLSQRRRMFSRSGLDRGRTKPAALIEGICMVDG